MDRARIRNAFSGLSKPDAPQDTRRASCLQPVRLLYLFEEDGRFDELISNEYQTLNLSHSPDLTRVSSGKEAIILAKEERRFDLILTTLHVEDMTAVKLAQLAREAGVQIPIVLLAYDSKELKDLKAHNYTAAFDRVFVWNGDFRLIVSIIKHLEDRMNVDHDTRLVGVQSILFIEDNIQYCSTLLPVLYTELMTQSLRLLSEGLNLSHKFLGTVARPRSFLARPIREAWNYFEAYKDHILSIISDVDFPREEDRIMAPESVSPKPPGNCFPTAHYAAVPDRGL